MMGESSRESIMAIISLPPTFNLSENYLLVSKCFSKNAKFWDENPSFQKNFGANLKF